MSTPKTMRVAVHDYLAWRRMLGFELLVEGQELTRFARFADEVGHRGPVTIELAVRWATLPAQASRIYHARRLDCVRRLARHLTALDPSTEIPPEGLLGPSYRRREPHIYSEAEIASLMARSGELGPSNGLRPQTFATLFGLLASTGLRISEALGLARCDVDLESSVITVTAGKFHKARLVPVDPTVIEALGSYATRRDRYKRGPLTDRFFVSEFGTSLKYTKVISTFSRLRRQLGWCAGRDGRMPRIHDLRHTFAVRRLLRWYQQGADIDRMIGALSTYLGHVKVSDTYWYLTAVPELLAIAAAQFERVAAIPSREDNP